nr:hypothetical protein CFP56_22679 [Quercus suber]
MIHRLAGRFFTKRVLSIDAVARTFKLLWKSIKELKIQDIAPIQPHDENGLGSATAMESDENLVDVDSSNVGQHLMHAANQFDLNYDSNRQRTANPRGEREHARGLEA